MTQKKRPVTIGVAGGTGSGKTFTALGIAKRFELQNKNNILIVVPTDKKAKDWISEAQHFDLQIHQLKDIKDFRKGITVTTYANFYQNVNILKITYDLVIYDESHYLLQNAQGDFTEALYKHREVANLPSKFKRLYTYELREKAKVYNPTMNKYFVNEDEFEKLKNLDVLILSALRKEEHLTHLTLDEAIAFGNKVAEEKAMGDRQRVIDSNRTTVLQITDAERQQWVDAMKPVWKQFERQIGKDVIDAAIQSNN